MNKQVKIFVFFVGMFFLPYSVMGQTQVTDTTTSDTVEKEEQHQVETPVIKNKSKLDMIKGALIVGVRVGRCIFRPFVKVGDTENDDEGRSQILGFEPGNVHFSRLHPGVIIYERVYAEMFLRRGMFKAVKGSEKPCTAPPY